MGILYIIATVNALLFLIFGGYAVAGCYFDKQKMTTKERATFALASVVSLVMVVGFVIVNDLYQSLWATAMAVAG